MVLCNNVCLGSGFYNPRPDWEKVVYFRTGANTRSSSFHNDLGCGAQIVASFGGKDYLVQVMALSARVITSRSRIIVCKLVCRCCWVLMLARMKFSG